MSLVVVAARRTCYRNRELITSSTTHPAKAKGIAGAVLRSSNGNLGLLGSLRLVGERRAYHTTSSAFAVDTNKNKSSGSNHSNTNIGISHENINGTPLIKDTPGKGRGLFASRDVPKGTLVMSSIPLSLNSQRGSHTIQVDWKTHLRMDLPAVLVNHSCAANLGITDQRNAVGYDFWTLRDIREGEELTWDYETSEWELAEPFECACGSPLCRGRLRGFKHAGSLVRKRYGDAYIAGYLKKGVPHDR